MNDRTSPTPVLQEQIRKARNSKYVKYALVGLAAAGGAFLAVRASLNSITTDVHTIAESTGRIDHNVYNGTAHVVDEIHHQQRFRHNMRSAITEATADGENFDFYPGIGVHYPDKAADVVQERKAS